ncbi:EAL domain-containing protein, partial [Ralstonia pseudosolanacearum]|uniref:EAL domain-containing protein n=1 Tax=Ralstonia pseudosolanacearum TaxID=1310165 RepID=UPI003D2C5469
FSWVEHLGKPVSGQGLYPLLDAFLARVPHAPRAPIARAGAHALASGEFTACFQPQARSDDIRGLFGLEALVRWRDGNGVTHPPAAFLEQVQRQGMESAMLRHIVPEALDLLARLRDRWPALKLSFNITPDLLAGDSPLAFLLEACQARRIAPGAVTLELTESPIASPAI